MSSTQISTMTYSHYIGAPSFALLSVVYIICEIMKENLWPERYEREVLTLAEDGGTVGIDWVGGVPDPGQANKKPILLVFPGLGGGSQNLYCTSM